MRKDILPTCTRSYMYLVELDMRGSKGGTGDLDPHPHLENCKFIGFLNNTGPDQLENHKATKLAFNVEPL